MAEASQDKPQGNAVQTTGHSWDGDLQEFNNPLPSWWLWSFYATAVFALVYWILYPAWPVGDSYTKGVATTTFMDSSGNEVTMGWNTRAEFIKDMQSGDEAIKQAEYLKKVEAASYDQIANDPDMTAFTQSLAKVLFADNCAACHGTGGTPSLVGQYPNLRDDAWLWGGKTGQIQQTIENGRLGYMPPFREVLDKEKIDQLAHYVLSLSGHAVDATKAEAGAGMFLGAEGGCHYCHTQAGTGLHSQGAANLTDAIWTVADVNGAADIDAKLKRVREVISNGISRQMPAWKERLSETEIKLLTVYVHGMGGGE